ncbi:MAG TPA: hypothetical protein VK578_14920, partial [Edaphobacter sp.]|nr:hypothetical protein [Edaphobacter sp.]
SIEHSICACEIDRYVQHVRNGDLAVKFQRMGNAICSIVCAVAPCNFVCQRRTVGNLLPLHDFAGYDDFNRLSSRTVYAGTAQNFSYVYDRYGNRWQQNVTAGSGPSPQLSFNTATNRISTNGYAYDAAGNLTNDGFHTYTYDAEGNITAVDGGGTAQYVYNALNQRVRTVVGSTPTEFVFNSNGQRVSVWNGSTRAAIRGQYYWGAAPVAYLAGGALQFQHQDWLEPNACGPR